MKLTLSLKEATTSGHDKANGREFTNLQFADKKLLETIIAILADGSDVELASLFFNGCFGKGKTFLLCFFLPCFAFAPPPLPQQHHTSQGRPRN